MPTHTQHKKRRMNEEEIKKLKEENERLQNELVSVNWLNFHSNWIKVFTEVSWCVAEVTTCFMVAGNLCH